MLKKPTPPVFDDNACIEIISRLRWPEGPACYVCNGEPGNVTRSARPKYHRCRDKDCHQLFSITGRTALEGMSLPMGKFFKAIWLIETSVIPVNVSVLSRFIGVTYKTGMLTRDRINAMKEANDPLYAGIVNAIAEMQTLEM